QLGVASYLLKPLNRKQLIDAVESDLLIDEQRDRVDRMTKMVDSKLLDAHQSDLHMNESIRAANQYMDDHLSERTRLRQVGEHVHLNPSYLNVLFKKQMHMTFSEYITRRRLQKAKGMLLHTMMPITEISEQVGYKTAKYFTTIFKEYEGISPGQYRSGLKTKV